MTRCISEWDTWSNTYFKHSLCSRRASGLTTSVFVRSTFYCAYCPVCHLTLFASSNILFSGSVLSCSLYRPLCKVLMCGVCCCMLYVFTHVQFFPSLLRPHHNLYWASMCLCTDLRVRLAVMGYVTTKQWQ